MKKIVRENGIVEHILEEEDQQVTEVSREILWQGPVEELVVKEYWDSHGDLVDWNKQTTYNNVKVRLERVTRDYVWFGGDPVRFVNDELFINDEEYDAMDIESLKGTTKKALAKAIIGQG